MDSKTFNHGFTSAFGDLDIKGINGYTKCLKNLFLYLAEKTEYKPEKRLVDSVEILEMIEETNKELALLLQKELSNLSTIEI